MSAHIARPLGLDLFSLVLGTMRGKGEKLYQINIYLRREGKEQVVGEATAVGCVCVGRRVPPAGGGGRGGESLLRRGGGSFGLTLFRSVARSRTTTNAEGEARSGAKRG